MTFTLLIALAMMAILPMEQVRGASSEFVITKVTPGDNSTVRSAPSVEVDYLCTNGINVSSVELVIDGTNVTSWDETAISDSNTTCNIPSVLALEAGSHNVTFEASDLKGNVLFEQWQFTVNPNATSGPVLNINFGQVVTYTIIGAVLVGLGFGVYVVYLNRTKGFTFEKYFARKPLQKHYLVLYVPIIAAFIFTIMAILLVENGDMNSPYAYEMTLVAAFFIAVTPYAIDVQLEMRRKRRYEAAFAQFLFELADAIRGGIDPAKAIIEFSGLNNSELKKRLRIAADGIRLGRPFEEMMQVMAAPIQSELVHRYASLISEAAKTGGDISVVLHRAAKDMDDLIKIDYERRRQLSMQTTTIYMAFAILMAVIWQLIGIYSTLGNGGLSITVLGQTLSASGSSSGVSHMSFIELKQRLLELTLVNSLTAGLMIGAFTEGKIKFGLIHALVMLGVSTVFFILFIL